MWGRELINFPTYTVGSYLVALNLINKVLPATESEIFIPPDFVSEI